MVKEGLLTKRAQGKGDHLLPGPEEGLAEEAPPRPEPRASLKQKKPPR